MVSRSSALRIFEVAWRSKASMASSRTMPQPSSVIWISFLPPASTLTRMRARARIQRVLQQLLDHRSGPLDYLARRDLVGYIFGENVDAAHDFKSNSPQRHRDTEKVT